MDLFAFKTKCFNLVCPELILMRFLYFWQDNNIHFLTSLTSESAYPVNNSQKKKKIYDVIEFKLSNFS